ncbi:MAG: pitrilysin family protein, partial [Jaaginema sp. PMC 1079.18]|nr:pitrilysin family protein [Jaaginema sp. PMC 1079.18]
MKPRISASRRLSWRWLHLAVATLLLVIVCHRPAIASEAKHYTELEFGPLPEVQIPDYERYQLDNGMTVYLMENHELPLVSGTALIRTGSRYEPLSEVGLAAITGTVMRSGGTTQHPPDELNQLLEQRAAVVETDIDTNSGSASFSALSEDLNFVFELFAETLQQPAFPQDKIDLAKQQIQGSIARRNDDPDDIASREFEKLVYGESSPYARMVEYETLDNITREDVVAFYEGYVRPENLILGIVGDFDPAMLKPLIAKTLGGWQPAGNMAQVEVPEATQKNLGGLFVVDRPQLTQSYIQMGHIGGEFSSPDYPALSVLNGVLNGFGGRLFNEVRSRQGLAYVAYGYWGAQYDHPGLFTAGGQTRSDATVPFIATIFEELEKLRSQPISEAELSYAKESILNSFVFNFQNPEQTLSRLLRYDYYDYPTDFIFQYQQAVKNVTIADIQRVAREYLQPEQIVTLVVGNQAEIQPPLSSLS